MALEQIFAQCRTERRTLSVVHNVDRFLGAFENFKCGAANAPARRTNRLEIYKL